MVPADRQLVISFQDNIQEPAELNVEIVITSTQRVTNSTWKGTGNENLTFEGMNNHISN